MVLHRSPVATHNYEFIDLVLQELFGFCTRRIRWALPIPQHQHEQRWRRWQSPTQLPLIHNWLLGLWWGFRPAIDWDQSREHHSQDYRSGALQTQWLPTKRNQQSWKQAVDPDSYHRRRYTSGNKPKHIHSWTIIHFADIYRHRVIRLGVWDFRKANPKSIHLVPALLVLLLSHFLDVWLSSPQNLRRFRECDQDFRCRTAQPPRQVLFDLSSFMSIVISQSREWRTAPCIDGSVFYRTELRVELF